MAFHEHLSRTWQIVLAIFCFPCLPFYLCYVCYSRRDKDDDDVDNTARAEEGRIQTISGQPRVTGQTADIQNVQWQEPVVAFNSSQRTQVIAKQTGYDNQGQTADTQNDHWQEPVVTFNSSKRAQVFAKQTGHDNQGFEGDREQRATLAAERQGLHAYPWDRSNLKSMTLDLDQFKNLDAFASKVNVRSSVETLVNTLLQRAHSDLEKVRAIWVWICHHIQYDVEGYHDMTKTSCEPADVLRSGKSVCSGYAGLFEQMCSIAGIRCKTLSGFSKGASYRPGKVIKGESDHAWNAVYLDGRWHLLDSTWGSGSVHLLQKFTFRYNEFYFLTHPALFVNDHFPEAEEWQLLRRPLTLQQFERNVWYHSWFYSLGLLGSSAETCVIETENGTATVSIESRPPRLFLFDLNGAKEHGLMTLRRNGMTLEVYPQQTGTHSLRIFTKAPESKGEDYDCVLEYSLKCGSVGRGVLSLPKALIQPVGPSWLSEEKGLLEASPRSPVIHTEDGCCVVTVTRSKNLDVFATLDSDSSRLSEDTRRRHIWKTRHGNQVEFKVHLPHAGHFAFHVWAKKAFEAGGHQCALSYLLSCPNKSVTWPVFPTRYGDWEEDYELVTPLAGVLPAGRQVEFKLRLPGVSDASVAGDKVYPLMHSGEGFWEGSCNTSGASKVTVRASKRPGENTYQYLLEYLVERH